MFSIDKNIQNFMRNFNATNPDFIKTQLHKYNISNPWWSAYLNGKIKLTTKRFILLCFIFNINPGDVLESSSNKALTYATPVINEEYLNKYIGHLKLKLKKLFGNAKVKKNSFLLNCSSDYVDETISSKTIKRILDDKHYINFKLKTFYTISKIGLNVDLAIFFKKLFEEVQYD